VFSAADIRELDLAPGRAEAILRGEKPRPMAGSQLKESVMAKRGVKRATAKARVAGPVAGRAAKAKKAEGLLSPAEVSAAVKAAGGTLPGKATKAAKAAEAGTSPRLPLSGLDAAVVVLEKDGPLACGDIVARAIERGLWTTAGKTPAATIYSAIIREIARKGAASRFVKQGPGKFGLSPTFGAK
jgi:hypothetical protein